MNQVDRLIQTWRFSAASSSVQKGSRLLDIGAHKGDFITYLDSFIGPSVGIDPETDTDCSVGRHQLLAGYFPDRMPAGQFDAASLLAVVEHLDDVALEAVGRALALVVRPSGRVIVTVPSPAADGILDVIQRIGLIDGMDLDAHSHLTVDCLVDSWSTCGLRCLRRSRFEFGLNNLVVFEVIGGAATTQIEESRC